MRARICSVLTAWPFVCALAVLLLNDWWLKAEYPSAVSGKLSDFAGVAVVGMLLLAMWPQARCQIYLALAMAFLWWKSPLSQPVLELINAYAPVHLGRTVDYSDLVALGALPACSYVVAHAPRLRPPWPVIRRVLLVPIVVATVFGISATSAVPRPGDYGTVEPFGRDEIDEAIASVAARHGLACDACPLSNGTMVYTGKGLTFSYRFRSSNVLAFAIEPMPGIRAATACETADALRAGLKAMLAQQFKLLDYVEPAKLRYECS